ncbi:MAG: guanylate kinase [Actinomycetota bacterium]|nr:guanylate kinase [Actinomycetota bacterium]
MPPGRLLVVSGPGGVGKGTVVAALRQWVPELVVSVSATTRPRRPGEVDGVHYHFLDDDAFDALVGSGGLLEWAEFNGRRYGTPWAPVREALEQGRPVALEIEVQGARAVRRRYPEAMLVFLLPPSEEALRERLRRRHTDSADQIDRRIAIARWELAQAGEFDHLVVNNRVEQAADAIARILEVTPAADRDPRRNGS